MSRHPTGPELAAAIRAWRPLPGHAALWWLGQHGFVLRLGSATVYIDPFLSDHGKRRVPPLLDPALITDADIVVGTHDHRDHIDREIWPLIAAASPGAVFVVPHPACAALPRDLGLDPRRFRGLDDGEVLDLCGLRLHGVAAAHEFLSPDPESGRQRFMGVVVEAGGCSVYHSGDTCLYEGLHERLRRLGPTAMLIPINGRDAERLARNCIGNMTFQEAADLAGAIRPGLVVPTHFDMFLGNMEDPRRFADYVRVKYGDSLRSLIPEYGERIDVPPP
ncbi:MAG: MBL fold metallo-hydrolase [Lentisphaeria bacterium]|nr:MBL fold metallo-hydrolase [Lentisphaeria bacterium]